MEEVGAFSLFSDNSIQQCSTTWQVRRADSEMTNLCDCFINVLHNEWSAAGMLRTLAVPVHHPVFLQVDIAVGGVVGAGLQNWSVPPEVHKT